MNCGLLPISGEALSVSILPVVIRFTLKTWLEDEWHYLWLQLGEVSYHDYKGELYDEDIDEWEEIGQDLGPHNKVWNFSPDVMVHGMSVLLHSLQLLYDVKHAGFDPT